MGRRNLTHEMIPVRNWWIGVVLLLLVVVVLVFGFDLHRDGMIKGVFEDSEMSELVARTGRHQQRYEAGFRLIAGCIPFKYINSCETNGDTSEKVVEVLMINSASGPGLLFPKGGWENDETVEEAALREALEEAGVRGDLLHFLGYYKFKSKTLQDEFSPEGLCKASMFALLVKEELQSWPEQSTRQRTWLTIPKAIERCRHPWMREALEDGFSKWHADGMITTMTDEDHVVSSSPDQHFLNS